MTPALAIVGMACRYPDVNSPLELWENALAQRQAFRQMPPERLRLADDLATDRYQADQIAAREAALIEGFVFDRERFQVAESVFRAADLTHWLALSVAAEALADAGFPGGEGLPRAATGVLLGNTLTGECSQANLLRLRWPYVRRVVGAALAKASWSTQQRQAFLEALEASYKAPFPAVTQETLVGSLSNTIASRICAFFDLNGGGYAVDGAGSSSLLAMTTACSALVAGDLDVALAGGVDLSLDPFALAGLAGCWPGEGCGMVVLMRHADAVAQARPIYALIRGWGVASNGSASRPQGDGLLLAIERAYQRAQFDIASVGYFEAYGTVAPHGADAELPILSRARRAANPSASPAVISSITGNIGYTNAAAGVAGLIHATIALSRQILPPATGCVELPAERSGSTPALRVLPTAEPWPIDQPLRAGVSAVGVGGINAHIVLEAASTERTTMLDPHSLMLTRSPQDTEIFFLSAQDTPALQQQLDRLIAIAARLSRAELSDLAAHLSQTLTQQPLRAAVVAARPDQLAARLKTVKTWLANGMTTMLDANQGVFLGSGTAAPRIGFLFPGQESPAHPTGGALCCRFPAAQERYAQANLPTSDDRAALPLSQLAIVTASLAALKVLRQLGIEGHLGIGHSLGELVALHWAGAFDEAALLRIAAIRGKALADLGAATGAMARIAAGRREVEWLLNDQSVTIACFNAPRQTIISGERATVDAVIDRARSRGLSAIKLPGSHAFHSPLVAAAVPALAQGLAREIFKPVQRTVVSTVTGAPLNGESNLSALLCRQLIAPVRFTRAISAAAEHIDLWLEVGPGWILSDLVVESINAPAIATDASGPSLAGLLGAIGAVYALGTPINHSALFNDRFTRPFTLDWQPRFFVNPCELAPTLDADPAPIAVSFGEADTSERITIAAPPLPRPLPTSASAAQPEQERVPVGVDTWDAQR